MTISTGNSDLVWHSVPVDEVAESLNSDLNDGLGASEATRRQAVHGPNQLVKPERWLRLKILGRQFRDVLIWLLLGAAVTSALILGAWVDSVAIAAIVVLNAVLGYAQESRAHIALARLRDFESPQATVIRDGVISQVPAHSLVPGDIVILEPGDRVPADGRITQSIRLLADEAALTGESIPTAKTEDPVPAETLLADRLSMLYAGTTVMAGRGRMIVTAIGLSTEIGQLAALSSEARPRTPLQVDMARIGRRLALVAAVTAGLVFAVGLARSFPAETMVLTAVALAVAAIPEGLPAVITISLAGGVQRMAHRNAIVRQLSAVEALGAVDIICTDKTGTLTAPRLEVGDVVLVDGRRGVSLFTSADRAGRWLAVSAVLCNDAYRSGETWAGDPTEVALLTAAESQGVDTEKLNADHPRVDEAGFDSRRKMMSTVHEWDGAPVLLVKGAPESVLSRATTMIRGDSVVALKDPRPILDSAEALAATGVRTLGFAFKRLQRQPEEPSDEENDLCYLGLVGLREQIRPEVPEALALAASAGVRTVMVTGDHLTTGVAVADSIGLVDGEAMNGHQLARISPSELTASITDYRVFARVDPADKMKIVESWQATGARVAMTGDGVNDAPALNRADIGVAMGSGTDVTREAAAIVLADDNYATIVSAIAEGRRLFGNLRNVVHYLLSANASEVIYVLIGFLLFGHLGEPLLAVQLLWINLVSDALPAIALGVDRPLHDPMADPPGVGRDVLGKRNMAILLAQGLILAGAAVVSMSIGSFALGLDQSSVQTMVFSTLVFSQLLHALSIRAGNVRLGERSRIRSPGRFMIWALIGSAALHVVVVYSGIGATFLRTTPLGVTALTWSIAASLASMVGVRILGRVTSDWRREE